MLISDRDVARLWYRWIVVSVVIGYNKRRQQYRLFRPANKPMDLGI